MNKKIILFGVLFLFLGLQSTGSTSLLHAKTNDPESAASAAPSKIKKVSAKKGLAKPQGFLRKTAKKFKVEEPAKGSSDTTKFKLQF